MLRAVAVLGGVICLLSASPARGEEARAEPPPAARSAAYQWLDIALEATARDVDARGARPTVLSRTLAVALTAMYDAWAAYDASAVPTRPGAPPRRPEAERTQAHREKAIAYATYRALVDVYPQDAPWLAEQLRRMGFDPEDTSTDLSTPQGVGNVAAEAVLAHRRRDGANQLGDEEGSSGAPYSDYTGYQPVNTPERLVDPDRWQPIVFTDGKGGTVTPGFLTPHWHRVRPFALQSASQFRPPPPPRVGSRQLARELREVTDSNASLTPRQKAVVEFMRDGPRSTGQSGHWLRFAQAVSRRDNHGLDEDVKLFFAVANVAMDAFIAAWDAKRHYDSSRPWTLVRHLHAGRRLQGWRGPGRGVGPVAAEAWQPYSPSFFVTPPFPGYVSGHSTVSAACARVLELFTGSDTFGEVEVRTAGALTEEGFVCPVIQQRNGKRSRHKDSDCQVRLELPTFSATAELAGVSRILGGYHIQADNVMGLKLGRDVAHFSWPRLQAYFNGSARP